ncbi:MAG: hypothetical protein AAFU77_09930 [Myxococcota bacterium]
MKVLSRDDAGLWRGTETFGSGPFNYGCEANLAGDLVATLADRSVVEVFRFDGAGWTPDGELSGLGTLRAIELGTDFIAVTNTVEQVLVTPFADGADEDQQPSWGEVLVEAEVTGADSALSAGGFGLSLAVSGRNLVVGAPTADSGAGALFVFEVDDSGTPRFQARALAPNAGTPFEGASATQIGDRFSSGLAVWGPVIGSGAIEVGDVISNSPPGVGTVYVFGVP